MSKGRGAANSSSYGYNNWTKGNVNFLSEFLSDFYVNFTKYC